MRQSSGEGLPFFCYLSTNVVHGPLFVADRYYDQYRDVDGIEESRAKMYGMVANLEDSEFRVDDVPETRE